jgi:hypothetical protein
MNKAKLTISIDPDLAEYLRGTASVSSTIAEAVEQYRARELEAELERGYLEDGEEAERLDREWSRADAGVDE